MKSDSTYSCRILYTLLKIAVKVELNIFQKTPNDRCNERQAVQLYLTVYCVCGELQTMGTVF